MKIHYKSDKGAALVTVIMVMLITMILAAIVLTYITSQVKTEIHYENNISALHSAEAGLHKYLWDLNKDSTIATTIFENPIEYPVSNPIAEYELILVEDTSNRKIIEATGWMKDDPSVKRIIKATYAKRSFRQYVYFSDADPYGTDVIWWGSSDILYGPFHTNTKLCIYGSPKFYDTVSYVVEPIRYNTDAGVVNNPHFEYMPFSIAKMDYPDDNNSLMSFAIADGTRYTGITRILLHDDGKITIRNRNNPTITLDGPPPNGVIYVNGTTVNGANKFAENAGNVFISGTYRGRLTVGSSNDIYVTAYDPTQDLFSDSTVTNGITYNPTSTYFELLNNKCFDRGTTRDDMLGLVAYRHVAVLTKGWFGGDTDAASARNDISIHAAIFAVTGKFINSCFIDGSVSPAMPNPAGTLTVRGAIIQSTRGTMGYGIQTATTSGYAKNYAHDPRMTFDAPPNFLEPSDSGWEIVDWTELN